MSIEDTIKFNAEWIAPANCNNEQNVYFYARTKLDLDDTNSANKLYIAAGTNYILYINGDKVETGPARGNKGTIFYDTIHIKHYLRQGSNHIAFMVFCPNMHNHVSTPIIPGLLVQLDDGQRLITNASWEVIIADEWKQDSEFWANKFGAIEYRDFRKTPKGWQGFQDNHQWHTPVIVSQHESIAGKKVVPRDIPMLQTSTYRPASIVKTTYTPPVDLEKFEKNIGDLLHNEAHEDFLDNKNWQQLIHEGKSCNISPDEKGRSIAVIFDFDREVSGGFELEISAPAGTVIDIAYCDFMLDNNRIKVSHFGPGSHNFCARFITDEGHQVIEDSRRQMGYRYFQLTLRNFTEPVTIHSLKAIDIRYPYTTKNTFRCSDERLNKIWDTCLETISVCTNDTFMDCPWRERALWINDMIVTGLTALQAFGDPRIVKRCLKLANGDRQVHNLIPAIVPATSCDMHILIPTCLYFLLELYDYWMYSGDDITLNEILPDIEENYQFFEQWEDETCHITPPAEYWNFFEWSYESCDLSLNNKKSANLNWLYAWCLRVLSQLLQQSGNEKKASYYAAKIPKIVSGMKKHFQVNNTNNYADWLEKDNSQSEMISQLSHALAILSSALSEAEERELANTALFNSNFHEPELFMSHFQFMATEKTGNAQLALDKIRRLWGNIVDTGSPTIWENAIYKPGQKFANGSGSMCHAFSTAPVSFFQRSILGIRPLTPGFKTFLIEPDLLDLTTAEGCVSTPYGPISISCTKAKELTIQIETPNGITGVHQGQSYESGTHTIIS